MIAVNEGRLAQQLHEKAAVGICGPVSCAMRSRLAKVAMNRFTKPTGGCEKRECWSSICATAACRRMQRRSIALSTG